jgi:hypothetical protein
LKKREKIEKSGIEELKKERREEESLVRSEKEKEKECEVK